MLHPLVDGAEDVDLGGAEGVAGNKITDAALKIGGNRYFLFSIDEALLTAVSVLNDSCLMTLAACLSMKTAQEATREANW